MKTYGISLPITGVAHLEVEAESEEEAIEKAFKLVTINDIDEWEALEHVSRGNVCYAMQPWDVTVDYVSDED